MNIRVKLSRRPGSKLPEGAINCARPGPYGNPFRVIDHDGKTLDKRASVMAYRNWLKLDEQAELRERMRRELPGNALACWCEPSEEWCHLTVIIDCVEGRI